MGLDTVQGVPVHPLVVHAVVVLVPLAALGVLAVLGRPVWRARYAVVVAAFALLDVVLVPLATSSGEELERRVVRADGGTSALLEKHTQMGEQLLPFVVVLAVGAVLLALVERARTRPGMPAVLGARWVVPLAAVLALVGSTASLVQVVRIGHSGARAAWDDVSG